MISKFFIISKLHLAVKIQAIYIINEYKYVQKHHLCMLDGKQVFLICCRLQKKRNYTMTEIMFPHH